jgi:integrase/recombinase XerC
VFSSTEVATFGESTPDDGATAALARPPRPAAPALPGADELLAANLYGVCELVAARAARPSTRRQYGAIYRRFCDALRSELGRPPEVGDLSADAIAAYARALERDGGRGGRPMALATRRVHLTMLRALAAQLGLEGVAGEVRPPSHRVGPPETLTHVEYANLVRVPDRRTQAGKRDHALLRVLGDCGLRNEELRGLCARALRRPRANARHHRLYLHGKGGTEREVPVPVATQEALEAWLASHPLRRGASALRDEEPVFVRLVGEPGPLSNAALHKLLRRCGAAAGVAERLAHPHTLRAYYATTLAAEGVPVHVIAARLGHAEIQTTSRYLAELADDRAAVGDVLDRHHQGLRRRRVAS